MSARTRLALWSFWEYVSFVINSLVFLLIGMQVRVATLLHEWRATLLAMLAVLLGRALSVYGLTQLNNRLAQRIPERWQHVLVWGGLHGSLSLALALSLGQNFPYRSTLLTLTFGVVAFSIILQGLTIKPLVRFLSLSRQTDGDDFAMTRVQQIAASSARTELDELVRSHSISAPVYERLRRELDTRIQSLGARISELYSKNSARADAELHAARIHLAAAEKSSIESALHEGLISTQTAARLIDMTDKDLAADTNDSEEIP